MVGQSWVSLCFQPKGIDIYRKPVNKETLEGIILLFPDFFLYYVVQIPESEYKSL